MFAFGVLVWEIFSLGSIPYPGMTNVEAAEAVIGGYRLPKPEKCPENVCEIVQRCWFENPKERVTMEQIVQDVQKVYYNM